ncbi:DUF1631 family protein [Niveibacterium sp. SC-1]|uniref:DUF1631 family protein n=1 Tax=Niveibacterium sp. SC-1 TaxID=3135646 RepID=UPI00311DF07B
MTQTQPDNSLKTQMIQQGREALLDTLTEYFREQGFIHDETLEALRRGAADSHDELLGIKDRRGFEAARGLTASRISLVREEDLEFTIRLTDLARHLRERCEGVLAKLHLRYMSLLDQSDASQEQLPIGVETVCCAVRALSDEAGLSSDERLSLVERIEPTLGHRLLMLYNKLNQVMESAGVETKSLVRNDPPAARGVASESGGLDQVPQRQAAGPVAELQRALMSRQAVPAPNAVTLDPSLAAAVRDRVLGWLSEQQQSAGDISQRLGSTELGPLLAPANKAALDTIERVFENLLAHPRLPTSGKGAIARLRVPLLKLAITDPALISDRAHPARRLLDAMCGLCVGLGPDTPPDHAITRALNETAGNIQRNFDRDVSVFATELPRIEAIASVRLAGVRDRAQQYVEAANRVEREETAARLASKALRAMESDTLPTPVRAFLENHWQAALQEILLSHGDKGSEWRNGLMVADRLIWSVQPKQTPEERNQLLKLLPELLRRMQRGLERSGLEGDAQQAALAPCMALHTAAMQGRVLPAASQPYPGPTNELRLNGLGEVSGLRVLSVHGFISRDPEVPELVSKITEGQWLEIELPDGRRVRGCVGWIAPSRQVMVLVDPDRQGVLAVTLRALVQQAQAGNVRQLAESSLFDQAAQAALRSLRGG